jgi:hypothetical protein
MQRTLLPFAAASLLAAAVNAQCYEQNLGILAPITGGVAGMGDDVLFDLQPMGFAFPMGGLAASYTHAHVCSNGVIYLTNGANSTGTTYAYQLTSYFDGPLGSDPRIAPFWIDLESAPQFGGGTYINNTIPGKFVVTWLNTVEWATQGPPFTFQAQLFANGDVQFFYNSTVYGISVPFGPQSVSRCGISQGNGVAAQPIVDLSVGATNLSSFYMLEEFPQNVFDLQSTTIRFVYAGTGYVEVPGPCQPASHTSYGSGCYDLSNSFYQFFPDASGVSALNGQSMSMTLLGPEYLVMQGGGTFVAPPLGAINLGLGDDSEMPVTPSIPFPTSAGPVATIYVGSNGIVSMATNPDATNYFPDAQTFLNCPVMAFWSWHDFNPSESGSGPVNYHEAVVGGQTIAYVTWNGVESYPGGVLNPSTMQFQLNLTTGDVKYVWVTMDGNTASPYGSGHLVGWSPAGLSTDPGSVTLATMPPFVTSSTQIAALALSASPPPLSTATTGTIVTYTTSNMRAISGPGPFVGLNILSLGQVPGGLGLGFIGAPGCSAYVLSLDYTQAMVGLTSTNSVTLTIPPGVPTGTQLFSQSVNLIPPNSLPNGQNAFGMLTSNGVKTTIAPF